MRRRSVVVPHLALLEGTTLEKQGIKPLHAEVGMYPDTHVRLEGDHAAQMVKLMQALEDHDDVQNVYANFDIDEEELEALA